MELQDFLNAGLDEEQAKIAHNLHLTDVEGLKSKNGEVIGKNKQVSEQLEEARKAASKAEQEKLIAEGKYKEAQELAEKERAELVAKANSEADKWQNVVRDRDLLEVKSQIMRDVHDSFTKPAEALLNSITKIEYSENGEKTLRIVDGDKEFTSVDDFKEHAKTDPTWSAMIKASDTKGIGANRNAGSGQAAQGSEDKDAAYRERLRQNGLFPQS